MIVRLSVPGIQDMEHHDAALLNCQQSRVWNIRLVWFYRLIVLTGDTVHFLTGYSLQPLLANECKQLLLKKKKPYKDKAFYMVKLASRTGFSVLSISF